MMPFRTGTGRKRAWMRVLGAGLEGLVVLPARYRAASRTLAGQPPRSSVRGTTQQGSREDGHQTEG